MTRRTWRTLCKGTDVDEVVHESWCIVVLPSRGAALVDQEGVLSQHWDGRILMSGMGPMMFGAGAGGARSRFQGTLQALLARLCSL
jgi:hypothetical protein